MTENPVPFFGKFTMLFDLLQTAAIAVLGFVMWVRKPGEQALTENDAQAKRIANIEQRIETIQEQAITRDEFYKLRENYAVLDARMDGVNEKLERVDKTLGRIEDFLRRQEDKA